MRSILVLVLAAGCFDPKLGHDPFLCGLAAPRCPPGYQCRAGVCWDGAGDGGLRADARSADGATSFDGTIGVDAAPAFDASVVDGGQCSGSTTPQCVGDDLVSCSNGMTTIHHCPTGCHQDRCYTLVPTNLAGDSCAQPALGQRQVTGDETLDTTACDGGELVSQSGSDAPKICVLRYSDLLIAGGASLTARGAYPLAIVTTSSLRIAGKLDVSAAGETGGAGSTASFTLGRGEGSFDTLSGAGGAGYGDDGGSGAGSSAGFAGLRYGTPEIQPLYPGSFGGQGCPPDTCIVADGAGGGGGGGGLQLVACGTLTLDVGGVIAANGGGGAGGKALGGAGGGSGGGSGGSILIEAGELVVPASFTITANGGGGGGGGSGGTFGVDGDPGADGLLSLLPAAGGPGGAVGADSDGGNGGSRTATAQNGSPATLDGDGSGGGGAAVGRIRLNARVTPTPAAEAVISPAPSLGTIDRN